MEELRDQARKTLASWMPVAETTGTEVPRMITQAIENLASGIVLLQEHRRSGHGIVPETGGGAQTPPPPPAWHSATAILNDAGREIFNLRKQHHSEAKVLDRFTHRRLGHHWDRDPEWHRWRVNHNGAIDHASKALENLRLAASHAREGEHAFHVAQTFPPQSPERNTQLAAALSLSRRAVRAAIVALHDSRRMSRAVALEVRDASVLLDH